MRIAGRAAIPLIAVIAASSSVCGQIDVASIERDRLEVERWQGRLIALQDSLEDASRTMFADEASLAPIGPFENDAEYASRLSRAWPQPAWGQPELVRVKAHLRELFERRFATDDLTIEADPARYDANAGRWPVTFAHTAFGRERFSITLEIARDQARVFNDNLAAAAVTGELAIDLDGQVRLARIMVREPVSGFSWNFSPMLTLGTKSTNYPADVCFTPDGRTIAAILGDEVKLYTPGSKAPERSVRIRGPRALAPASFGRLVAVARWDGFDVVDVPGARIVESYGGSGADFATDVVFGPWDAWICGSDSRNVHIFDRRLRRPITTLRDAWNGRLDPQGGSIIHTWNPELRRYDLTTGQTTLMMTMSAAAQELTISPDGRYLAIVFPGNSFLLYDQAGDVPVGGMADNELVSEAAFSSDGTRFALAMNSGELRVFDLTTKDLIWSELRAGAHDIAFSPDGAYLASIRSEWLDLFRIEPAGGADVSDSHGDAGPGAPRAQKGAAELELLLEPLPVEFVGESSGTGNRWPMRVRVVSYDRESHKVAGEIEWPTLDALHRMEGTLTSGMLEIREVDYIRRGRGGLGCTYELRLDGDRVLVGTWGGCTGSADRGQTRLEKR